MSDRKRPVHPSARPGLRLGGALRDPDAKAVLAVVASAATAQPGPPGPPGRTGAAVVDRVDDSQRVSSSLVRSAAEGLAERDRVLLALSAAGTYSGTEMAAIVDVPPSQIYTVLNRMRRRAWRAIASVILVRSGAGHCSLLAGVLHTCDGFSPLVRKRVARHLDGCVGCHQEVVGRLAELIDLDVTDPAEA